MSGHPITHLTTITTRFQARAVQMLAEHLLDSNFSRGGTSEFKANLQHNLSDAISLLPKLTTGIDINVKFDGIRSLEYTAETAVFDLLAIDLIHGWLCDPQDRATAAAIGSQSYNELVLQLISVLGGGSGGTNGDGSTAAADFSAAPATNQQQRHHKIDAKTLSAALQSTLRVSIPDGPPTGIGLEAGSGKSSGTTGDHKDSTTSQDSVTKEINRMVRDTVKEAFKTPTSAPLAAGTYGSGNEMGQEDASTSTTTTTTSTATTFQEGGRREPLTPAPSVASVYRAGEEATTLLIPMSSEQQGEGDGEPRTPLQQLQAPPKEKEKEDAAMRDALLIQEFFHQNPSQLTVFGLSSIIDGLPDRQLAVFFRNNHFNVVLKSDAGLFLLVTDQGYLWESDVVWEHLNNVDGDTELLSWDLTPFKPHGGNAATATTTTTTTTLTAPPASQDAAMAQGGVVNEDADLALALQLQQEEEERLREAEERRRAGERTTSQQQDGYGGSSSASTVGRPPRTPSPNKKKQPSPTKPPKKKSSDLCKLM